MTRNGYDEYYLQQAGHGMPVFIGGRYQRGRGIGNILGGLARMVVPILKRGGRTLLKEGLRTGMDIIGDVAAGRNIKASAKSRSKQSVNRLMNQARDTLNSPPGKRQVVKKRKPSKNRSQSNKRSKRRRTNDIFG